MACSMRSEPLDKKECLGSRSDKSKTNISSLKPLNAEKDKQISSSGSRGDIIVQFVLCKLYPAFSEDEVAMIAQSSRLRFSMLNYCSLLSILIYHGVPIIQTPSSLMHSFRRSPVCPIIARRWGQFLAATQVSLLQLISFGLGGHHHRRQGHSL